MNAEKILQSLGWIDQVAGGVWIVLTGLMIYLAMRIYRQSNTHLDFWLVLILIVMVWAYPLYTGFYQDIFIGEMGNIVTLLFTIFVMYRARVYAKPAPYLLLPQIIWLSVASLYLALMISVQST